MSVEALEKRNFNLDCKNPYEETVDLGDPDTLMAEYQEISQKLRAAQDDLKAELMAALEATS